MKGIFFPLILVGFILLSLSPTLTAQTESSLKVTRMVLCDGVENREPTNASVDFTPDVNRVYCYTEIKDAGDPCTISHRWYYGEQLMAEIPLNVQGARYRTWSSKQIVPKATGEWKVEVVDDSGTQLGEIAFRVSAVETSSGE
jgi:hypothetical protein